MYDITDMYYVMNFEDQDITLEYILMSMRTRTNWSTNLLFQVGMDRNKKAVAYCHKDEYEEATSVISNLYHLLKYRYKTDDVSMWFKTTAIRRAQRNHFDGDKMINKENEELDAVLPEKNCKMSPANMQKAIMEGQDLDQLPSKTMMMLITCHLTVTKKMKKERKK